MDSFKSAVKQLMLNTTLHGCRHLAEDGRHWMERIIWTAVQVTAVWGMTTAITDLYEEYLASPTITTLETTQYQAWNVPFPAIGICNVNKISRKEAEKLAEEINLVDRSVSKDHILSLLHHLGDMFDQEPSSYNHLQELSQLLKKYGYETHQVMERLSPSCSTLLRHCRWRGRKRMCAELFKPMATINGFCCVFNLQRDGGEQAESLQSVGFKSGLTVIVDPQPQDYFYPVTPTYGAQVMIFSPFNYPQSTLGMIEYTAAKGRELFYTISVFTQYATEELRTFEPQDRGCVFAGEKTSASSQHLYTLTDCFAEYMNNYVLEMCQCLPYYSKSQGQGKVCDLSDLPCLARSNRYFAASFKIEDESKGPTCEMCKECLPACTTTWYDAQSSFATISRFDDKMNVYNLSGENIHENMSALHFYYPTLDTTLYKQDVVYTRAELVSNIGGIFSLFNGFSFLSMVEVLYFLTIRWYLIRKEDQENEMNSPSVVMEQRTEIRDASHGVRRDADAAEPYWNEINSHSSDQPIRFQLGSRMVNSLW